MSEDAALQSGGTVETQAETKKSPQDFVKFWLQAIGLASSEEEDWRKDARETLERYSSSKARSFNILYASTQTTVPALYNSEPVPDVRRRFGDDDEVGERVGMLLERAITIQAQLYDFDSCMKAAVRDRQLPGRGVVRVRVMQGENGSKWVACEQVVWDDFRRGPAKVWADVPWQAFRHKMTREELIALDPVIGQKVTLDATLSDNKDGKAKDGKETPDSFKRATVWEIWDKLQRQVYWIAESYKDGAIKVVPDPYDLRDFFCAPEPLYQVKRTDTLVPVCEFKLWKPLADEVDDITARIAAIVKVMKLRGLYDGAFSNIVAKLSNLNDGELAAADDPARSMAQGGIEKAIWMWPVDMAIKTVQGLYEAREQAKNHLYELTGVADILRGQTEPGETLGAQQIKAQWGSLRLQEAQRDVQRFARDLFRMMADLSAYALDPSALQAMTGVQLMPPPPDPAKVPPEQMQAALMQAQQQGMQALKILKSDMAREFAIDIETDSTIRADLTRAQQNISTFIQGLGAFFQGIGPAVQLGFMPAPIAIKMVAAFSRNFKLGREAEEALDEWEKDAEQKAANPQPPQPDPKAQADQLKAQADMQKSQAQVATTNIKAQAEQTKAQLGVAQAVAEHHANMREMAMEGALMQQQHANSMQQAALPPQQPGGGQ